MNENQEILYLLDNANHSPKKRRSYLKLFMDINPKGNERGTVLRTFVHTSCTCCLGRQRWLGAISIPNSNSGK